MKKTFVLFLTLCVLFLSMSGCAAQADEYTKYTMSFFGTFDTIIIVIGYAREDAVFNRVTAQAQAQFERLHQVFDGYNAYEGVNNLYYMNAEAAKGPISIAPELMDLLLYCKQHQPQTLGKVNVALGAMLRIWHDVRTIAEDESSEAIDLPSMDALQEAASHANMDDVILDVEKGTVYYADPLLKLDLGAVAKGYATEQVSKWLLQSEMPSFIINAGGNVRAGDPPMDGRLRWGISIQDPDEYASITPSAENLDVLFLANQSVVTSGDYQRFFMKDGKRYHHIISPETLMPANFVRAVTIVCENSAWADMLSTALFLMPYEEGRAFVDGLEGVEALWILPDRTVEMTDGMAAMARSKGATSR